jgi:hypothetical protein
VLPDRGAGVTRTLVEILTFEGCPNHEGAVELVERVAREVGIEPEVRLVNVPDGAAEAMRFLGSPTVRVDGHDIEPGADERTEFSRSCRVYRTESGFRGQPEESWLHDALGGARGA